MGCKFEKLLSYLKSTSSNLSKCKVLCKNKNSKSWTKKTLFWVFLDWNLKKLMSYLKSAPSSLSKYQHSSKTTTTIIATTKNKTKNVLFGYFVLWVWKTIVIIWNQHSRICRHAKNCSKQKKSKFGTKNVLFGHFGL